MTKTEKPPTIQRGKTFCQDMGHGIKLNAEVSPCVFMNAGYPLQIAVALQLENGDYAGVAYAVDSAKTADNAYESDVLQLLAGIRMNPCRRCAALTFDPSTVSTNRNGFCESCFVKDLQGTFAIEARAEADKIARCDQRMKTEGMRYRLTAWIHPEIGDDYQGDWYYPDRPTTARITTLLREKGSTVLDHFEIVTL